MRRILRTLQTSTGGEVLRIRRKDTAVYRYGAYSLSCCRTIYLTHTGELGTPGKLSESRRQLVLAVAWGSVRHGQWRVAGVASQVEHVSITVV